MSADPARALTVADSETLCDMIARAQRRVLYLAPAIHATVAEALAEAWNRLDAHRVTVIVDADAEVYRLGYGDLAALQKLQDAATRHGAMITEQPGVRMGLMIADDQTLVWAPVPEMIASGQQKSVATNAIRLGLPPADVERDLGAGPDGPRDQTIGLDPIERDKVDAVSDDLQRNPPQPFDISQKMRVFNAYFEFVELKLLGADVGRRTVKLPSDLMGITDRPTQQKLHAAFNLVPTAGDLTGKKLAEDRLMIEQRYLHRIKGHGLAIKRSDKADFKKDLEKLRSGIQKFEDELDTKLQSEIDESRKLLREALLPAVTKTPPKRWTESNFFDKDQIEVFLDQDLERAFGRARNLFKPITLTVKYRGVTYESLKDKEFMAAAREAFPDSPQLYDEGDAAPAAQGALPLTPAT